MTRPSGSLRGCDLLTIDGLDATMLRRVLDTADQLKLERHRGQAHPLLAGRTLAMIFQKPSMRTRVSFETGMTQLGGHAICLSHDDVRLGERESVEDAAIVLSRYVDLIMARTFDHDDVAELARHATVPVINGLSDHEHPCQALADLQTIREHKGRLEGLRLVYAGDGNNVAHSLMHAAALSGMDMVVVTPPGHGPDPEVRRRAAESARGHGGSITVGHDLEAAARGADVLYTDVWASMGQEDEAAERRASFRDYQLNQRVLAAADARCIILHCLPAHYGEEITYELSRTNRSAIFDQAENRLHAQKALMVLLAGA